MSKSSQIHLNAEQYTQVRLFELDDELSLHERMNLLYEQAGQAGPLAQQADAEDGWVEVGPYAMPVRVAAKQQELSPIRYRFGSWAVTTYGVECLTAYYPIPKKRLHQPGEWAEHLAAQSWVCLWDVIRALVVARDLYPALVEGQP